METIEKIRKHPLYTECYEKLELAESGRIFCRHQMQHFLDVARLAYIRNLEDGLGLDKEVIYAAALLHDIGKYKQYEDGTPHEKTGVQIAERILSDIGVFSEEEKQSILCAIMRHRKNSDGKLPLNRILYESDKLSRACYACPALSECNWSSEKKNMEIKL